LEFVHLVLSIRFAVLVLDQAEKREAAILISNKAFADWDQVFAGRQSCDVSRFLFAESWGSYQ
jgi:hypothetical protein